MPFQAVPDTASFKIVMRSSSAAVEINNIIYARNTVVGWSVGQLSDHAIAIGDAWRDNMMPLISSNATFDRVEARDEGAEFGNAVVEEYNTVGGVAGTPLSAMACIQVKIVGDSGGPPRVGRLFVSPFSEADIAVDVWDATLAGNVRDAVIAVRDAIDAVTPAPGAMVLVSRYSKTANPVAPHKRTVAETNTISQFVAVTALATQRDRRVGQGI